MHQTFTTVPRAKPQSHPLNILITGASRGIGYELVRQYSAAHPSNIILATARDPSTAAALTAFAATHPNVHVLPLDTGSEASIEASLALVPASVTHLDLLYNNAGVFGVPTPLPQLTAAPINELLQVNTTGPLIVTRTYLPLLLAASPHPHTPTVISITSELGATHLAKPVADWGVIPYGASKAALNFINLALSVAVPDVTFLAVSPGWVGTEMGNSFGTVPPVKTEDCVAGLVALAQEKGKKDSGSFFDVVTGKKLLH